MNFFRKAGARGGRTPAPERPKAAFLGPAPDEGARVPDGGGGGCRR
eukprot:CAMPEP_0113597564 /NCGR_PEP_ID=MMETSP0015_2-20120614/41082_1 /TAXON_ID=2838 /ORGANISM="Odontella" /LENGTH=45 /DNA_ID=CAMNT_0000505445 /DNA_START=228 /DNA_END=361 /DNA_ORIENTATION=- /assembly_acc=CAM_ASM_000160